MSTELAVVTVTYSPGQYLSSFIESLPGSTVRRVHVVMADNGSVDGTPEDAVERYKDDVRLTVELQRTGGNIGYGSAINFAVEKIRQDPAHYDADFILVSNPDVEFSPGSVDKLIAAAERWEKAGAFGPAIEDVQGERYPSARALPTLSMGIGHALLGVVWKKNPWSRAYFGRDKLSIEHAAGWLSGSCLLLRREAFDDVGGFDSRYFMYLEDVDLGDRLGKAGWQSVYVPDSTICHIQGHVADTHSATMLPAHHESAYRYQADRLTKWWQAPVRWILWLGLKIRSQIALVMARRRENTLQN